jgi:hypothetical protein
MVRLPDESIFKDWPFVARPMYNVGDKVFVKAEEAESGGGFEGVILGVKADSGYTMFQSRQTIEYTIGIWTGSNWDQVDGYPEDWIIQKI